MGTGGIRLTDLNLLYEYAKECKFIIETGAGESTKKLAKAARESNGKFISIEGEKSVINAFSGWKVENVQKMIGWSIAYNDLILSGHPEFRKTKNRKYDIQGFEHCVIFASNKKRRKLMESMGETDLIRKVIQENSNLELDFFFSDSGEYCGLPEWNVVNDKIKTGGYFAIHDIYYPKSIKGYKVLKNNRK